MNSIILFFKSCVDKSKNYHLIWAYIIGRLDQQSINISLNEISTKLGITKKTVYLVVNFGIEWFNKSDFEWCFYVKNNYIYSVNRIDFELMTIEKRVRKIKSKDPLVIQEKIKIHKAKIDSTEYNEIIDAIIDFMNLTTGKQFLTSENGVKELIIDRIKEGFKTEDFYKIIEYKNKVWKKTFNEQYLRPLTLFGYKMEEYLNEAILSKPIEQKSLTQKTYETATRAKSIIANRHKTN